MLQRYIHISTNLLVSGNGFEKAARDLVGIRVEETDPAQVLNTCQFFEQEREPVLEPKIFAVASRILSDERDLAYAGASQSFGLGDYGFESARAEFAAQRRN